MKLYININSLQKKKDYYIIVTNSLINKILLYILFFVPMDLIYVLKTNIF